MWNSFSDPQFTLRTIGWQIWSSKWEKIWLKECISFYGQFSLSVGFLATIERKECIRLGQRGNTWAQVFFNCQVRIYCSSTQGIGMCHEQFCLTKHGIYTMQTQCTIQKALCNTEYKLPLDNSIFVTYYKAKRYRCISARRKSFCLNDYYPSGWMALST